MTTIAHKIAAVFAVLTTVIMLITTLVIVFYAPALKNLTWAVVLLCLLIFGTYHQLCMAGFISSRSTETIKRDNHAPLY